MKSKQKWPVNSVISRKRPEKLHATSLRYAVSLTLWYAKLPLFYFPKTFYNMVLFLPSASDFPTAGQCSGIHAAKPRLGSPSVHFTAIRPMTPLLTPLWWYFYWRCRYKDVTWLISRYKKKRPLFIHRDMREIESGFIFFEKISVIKIFRVSIFSITFSYNNQ